ANQASEQQNDREVDELLEKLKELARRQEQEAERQRRRALQGQRRTAGPRGTAARTAGSGASGTRSSRCDAACGSGQRRQCVSTGTGGARALARNREGGGAVGHTAGG